MNCTSNVAGNAHAYQNGFVAIVKINCTTVRHIHPMQIDTLNWDYEPPGGRALKITIPSVLKRSLDVFGSNCFQYIYPLAISMESAMTPTLSQINIKQLSKSQYGKAYTVPVLTLKNESVRSNRSR